MGIVIGITGTNGAGKGTVVEYLIEKYKFKHFTFRGYFVEEVKRRGLEPNRTNIQIVANDLRATLGERYFDEVFDGVYQSGENYIAESVRTASEIAFLSKQPNTYLFAVDAPRELRYERAVLRNSETDRIPFEKFVEEEEVEMRNEDPNKQNLSYCIAQADPAFTFINDGDREALYAQVDRAMAKILE